MQKDSLMLPKKFKKRPVVIEAMQFTGDNAAEVAAWCGGQIVSADCSGDGPPYVVRIDTLEGSMLAGRGDYVICGVQGEFYPIKDAIFRETYEPIEGES